MQFFRMLIPRNSSDEQSAYEQVRRDKEARPREDSVPDYQQLSLPSMTSGTRDVGAKGKGMQETSSDPETTNYMNL